MAIKRQLAAIMFTDITGFSAMMESDEEYARRIRQRHRSVFKESHELHQGKILQYYGDGTLSIFDSAAAAVECAVEMQIEFRKEPEVPLRIGIHTGDISYDEDGAYGDGLNIAARIERLCIPGGVFVTAKVFDDIKNHQWLTASSMGEFHLRNIFREIEIYAITCKGLMYPSEVEIQSYPEYINPGIPSKDGPRGRKRKGVAFLLAFFFGVWGIHRLYLGQRGRGLTHLALAVFGFMILVNAELPWLFVLAGIIGLIDAVLLLAMPRAEFDYKYNHGQGSKKNKRPFQRVQRKNFVLEKSTNASSKNPALIRGIKKYKRDKYYDAIEEFHAALEVDPSSAAAHFNLTCCYSILRDHEDAYYHLAKAVENGFKDYPRIRNHEALSYLRSRDDFENFVLNGYRVVEQLPAPEKGLIEELQDFNPDVLERIESLGDLLEKGVLTREEFDLQKRRILGNGE